MKNKVKIVKLEQDAIEEIKSLLRDGFKVYLEKPCKREMLRHEFYQITDSNGHHFYHVRYSISDSSSIPKIKDYPVIDVEKCDVEDTISKLTLDICNNYLAYNGYSISCNRKEE